MNDARHDVLSLVPCDVPSHACGTQWERDRKNETADVTRTRIDYSDEQLEVAVKVRRSLPRTSRRSIDIDWEVRTSSHREGFDYVLSLGLHNRAAEATFCDRTNDDGTGSGLGAECRDISFAVDRARGTYRLSIPSSWLPDARWIRLNGVVDVVRYRHGSPYQASVDEPFDNRPQLSDSTNPVMTKRIFRG